MTIEQSARGTHPPDAGGAPVPRGSLPLRTGPLRLALLSGLSLAAFSILIALGIWQLQRRDWKHALIARVETRAHAAPMPLERALAIFDKTGDVEYLHVRLSGHFLHGQEFHLYALVNGKPGWDVITPLETGSGQLVLVDRGFVPSDLKDAASRPQGQIKGEVRLAGLVRQPGRPNWFTPDNEPEHNRWYWRDLRGMAARLSADERARLIPFFVAADAAAIPGGWPKGGTTRLQFIDRHLSYALTWFGLAGALVVIFTLFVRSRLRNPAKTH